MMANRQSTVTNVNFELEHRVWLDEHMRRSKGERKRRLENGAHGHGEREALRTVWVPAFGHLEHLHPEYEVIDFQGGTRYIDLAYLRPPYRIAIEIDGYGKHQRDITKREFCDDRVRSAFLINDGWLVIHIGYDDLKERPRLWQMILQQLIGKLYGHEDKIENKLYSQEREIVRLASELGRPVLLGDVKRFLQCGYVNARKAVRQLEDKQILVRVGGGKKRAYGWVLCEEDMKD
ncbi:DNA-binding response regulator [Cohnella lubricantis]|uniref:DNA-binding response regulator n=1 Tax=Cohnella lubricantis TaxID=2163172 RepID=A0A841TGJ3_9BACL|nr:DNA-binding response regulator [Cohnella lubricantis]MBB6678350.1 DNA-binding response regulator [Cohnella lubricantis]MBP2116730.1 hypothetical protein [Cohnella lubricantis]